MSRQVTDIAGKKINRLTVIEYAYSVNCRSYWLCKCDCGNEKIIRRSSLGGRNSQKSCGCILSESNKTKRLTHGNS